MAQLVNNVVNEVRQLGPYKEYDRISKIGIGNMER